MGVCALKKTYKEKRIYVTMSQGLSTLFHSVNIRYRFNDLLLLCVDNFCIIKKFVHRDGEKNNDRLSLSVISIPQWV
jgi:hypothetical protein